MRQYERGVYINATYLDEAVPVITCPEDVVIECDEDSSPAGTGSASAIDNCDDQPTITYSDVTIQSESCPQEYTIVRTWTAEDNCGNSSSCTQTITVDDSTPPTFVEGPGVLDVTFELTDPLGLCGTDIAFFVFFPAENPTTFYGIDAAGNQIGGTFPGPTGIDNCSDFLSLSGYFSSAGDECEVVHTLHLYYTDECGNMSLEYLLNATYIDAAAPVITCPVDVVIECDEDSSPANTGSATAFDNCDDQPSITFSDVTIQSESCPQEYTIQRTWIAEDNCGNSSSCLQTINVVDTTPPTFVNAPGSLDVTIILTDPFGACPTDIAFCVASGLYDNPATLWAEDGAFNIIGTTYPGPTAVDNCGELLAIGGFWTTSGNECENVMTWHIFYTDECGNTSEEFLLNATYIDAAAPAITCPADVEVECDEDTSPASTGSASAIDNCDNEPTITWSDVTIQSESCPQEYTILRTWTAVDNCGNSSSCTQTINVEDTTPPTWVEAPGALDVTISLTDPFGLLSDGYCHSVVLTISMLIRSHCGRGCCWGMIGTTFPGHTEWIIAE